MSKKRKQLKRDKEVAISVKGLSKTFQLPHQKIDSVRSAFVNLFAKNTYEEFKALDDVSFDVHKGEFIGILGHNGSGKSTLLKCLAGVYTPDEGKVQVNGRISPFLELGIGFNPELSGRDNIYLNATILGLSKKEIDQKFDEIVAFSEIGQFIDQQVKNYSSGMRSRLAFSVSVHANREILLMDEVLAVGDARFKDKCMEHFESYKNQGKTVILVTHSMGTVREHCDSAILLHEGKVVDVGEPNTVADHYIEVNLIEDQRRQIEKDERKLKEEEKKKKAIEVKRKKEANAEKLKKIKIQKEKSAILKQKRERDAEKKKKEREIEVGLKRKERLFLLSGLCDKSGTAYITSYPVNFQNDTVGGDDRFLQWDSGDIESSVGKGRVVIVDGVLEYLDNIEDFFIKCHGASEIIVSYHPLQKNKNILSRESSGWKSHMTRTDIVEHFSQKGYSLQEQYSFSFDIFHFKKIVTD